MASLDKRERDRVELELEECFKSLKDKVSDESEIESLMGESMREIKDDRNINIYKPNFKKNTPIKDAKNSLMT